MAKAAVKEKAEKIEAPKEEPAKAEKKKSGLIPRAAKFPMDHVITLLLDYNPKRPGTTGHAHFELYEDEMTVKQALEAGITRADMLWDTKHGFLKIEEEFDDDAEKASKPEKKAAKKEEKKEAPAAAPAKAETKVAGKKKPAKVEEEEDC